MLEEDKRASAPSSIKMKIALTIPTGRPRVRQVVKSFIENAILHGYNPKDFSIYLSIDTSYQNTKECEFRLNPTIERKVCRVHYIGETRRHELGEEIAKRCSAYNQTIYNLFSGNGYARQRNSALFLAIQDKNDIAICIDDDEAPFVPIKQKNGQIIWKELDFFGPHIKELSSGTDVTRGPYLGYLSPIPSDFERDIPEEIRKKLGEALQYGSDVITSHSFFDLMNKIRYLPEEELTNPSRPFIVEEDKNGKHVYAGNMGINLNSVRQGRIPIFFTPPNARGEDTIFALQLKETIVREVNSFIFHDPFDLYPEIFKRNFPKSLKNIPVTEHSKKRFASTLMGWAKYAPIFIELTSKDSDDKREKIEGMLAKIEEPTKELANLLNLPELRKCKDILADYYQSVQDHCAQLTAAQTIWRTEIVPSLI